ncbi:rhomboid family intramembrane serine protease [Curvibacter sp. APW13]|uniref:rhomboid family intramembrane serine protease n=1 Tax=Curvibacter sp. APW13 TaxID=3077236 RepID=UPI0028E01024|nr:rhomboid family intramembrane serine protease [Curvibacter sp. APW13]MDT8991371.1 rhomboid family intramembrane serine protease [Curvibacter sp. APW13]
MTTQPTLPAWEEQFLGSSNSSMAKARLWVWFGVGIGLLVAAATSKSGIGWVGVLVPVVFALAVDWLLRSRVRAGKVYATVDSAGIEAPAFQGKTKRYRWPEIAQVVLTRVQGHPMLQLVLHPTPGRPDKKGFWTGSNPARPLLPLGVLNDATQARLVDRIQQTLIMRGAEDGVPATVVQDHLADERAFQQRLKAMAPVPWLTYLLLGANLAVWLWTLRQGAGVQGVAPELLLAWGGNAASEVQRGEWWRLATSVFLHCSLMHVALNMLGLYSAGVTVERIYGHRLFALIYAGSGLVGAALSLHFAAQKSVSVGASGAVFGVLGALLVAMLENGKHLPKTIGKQALGSSAFFILYSLAQGFSRPDIDNAAHVGGLLAGMVLAWVLPERFDMEAFARKFASRAAFAVSLAGMAAVSLAWTAPVAALDMRGVISFQDGMRQLQEAVSLIQQDVKDVESGKRTEREVDERSRAVYAPMLRQAGIALERASLPKGDPRQPLLVDMRRLTALMLEAAAMESVFPADGSKPQPIDPVRSAEIERELKEVDQRVRQLASVAKNAR